VRTTWLILSARGRFLQCRDRVSGKHLQSLDNHRQWIRCIVEPERQGTGEHVLCSYDGESAIIWRESAGGLRLLNKLDLGLDFATAFRWVGQNVVLHLHDATMVLLASNEFHILYDSRFHSPEDQVSALARLDQGNTVALG
jgi:hypothetical protein